ncbi:LamG-like jellyroll fold domain-containing protein [Kribbella sp. NPDC056345]|uniref:LamG-like jellyroll fold domain-containing protein n=1 Tax=Kribbella sp. NPDC056345 TaxID=3345789 RepID=UPI0035DA1C43
MFGRPPSRRARWLSFARGTTTLLTAVALLATAALPARAGDEPPDGELPPLACPTFPGDPTAQDEFEAYRLALACNRNVEVLPFRDIDRQAFATPAGLLDTQIAVEPYWVQNSAGAWVDIDPTLAARPDGSAQAAATVIRIETGAGGTAPFVTATDPDGGVLSLTWPKGPLPKPTISGAVATYPNVLPDVDLAVQAEAVGFSWVLVVKTPEAAENPELKTIRVGITTVGLTVVEDPESGRIDVLNADGDVVFEAGQGIMWDSSPAGATARKQTANAATADPGRIGDVDVQKSATGLTLVPDTKMLADPDLKFPLYIDPPFTSTRKAWANVFQGRPSQGWTGDSSWPRSGGMRVGNDTWSTCGDGCGLWRSVVKLDIGKLKGKYIDSASVNMLQTHTGGCGDQGLQLWRTGEISNGTSWKSVNWWYGDPLQSKTVPSSNQTGCSGNSNEWVEFDGSNVKKRIQSAASNKDSTISFGVRSSNESSRDAWRRIKATSVKLHVTYFIYPPHPDRLTVDGTGCDPTLSGSPWINERKPTFSARVKTSESDSVYWRFRVHPAASTSEVYYYRTPNPVAASTQSRKSTKSFADGPYRWQARSDSRQYDAVNSGYTNYCYFRVDATVPRVPDVTGPTGAVTEGSNVTMNITGGDPTVNGSSSGLNRYEYSWNTDTFDQRLPGTSTTRLGRPAVAAGRHVLYIRAVDNAGNKSKHRVFTFFAGRNIPKTPMAAWPLGSDLVDDTSHGKNMSVLTGDPAFAADPVDPANSAVEFDGNDCLKAPTAIRTDAAFTVALSVRMDAMNSGYTKLLAQGNTSHSMYQIQHNAADNTWSFSLLDAPGDTYGWKSITVPNPVALGKWLRIVATYDPDAGLSRIYLNGTLAGEKAVSFTPWNATAFFSLGCLPTSSGGAAHTFTGAVDNVGVWQGLMTPTEITNGAKLPYGEIAHWDLRGDGTDSSSFGRDLTLPASAQQSFDPFGRPDGALVLDGQSCATTSTPIIPSDTPFGIGTWVKPGQVTGGRQVLFSQADSAGDGFAMMITADGKWELGSLSQIGLATMGTRAAGGTYVPPKAGWQYVEFQYHGDGKWTASVDGREGMTWTRGLPGRADAPLTIGCHDRGQGQKDFFKGLLHDVQVWRGVKPTASLKESAPAEVASWWSLEETGVDETGKGRNLTFSRQPQYNDGWWDNPDSALELDGTNYAATTTPVVNTDESFTVGAWVRLDALDAHQTIVAASGANNTALRLRFSTTYQRFEFGMAAEDTASATTHWTSGGPAPTVGTWYFVVGSYNLRTKMMRIYVDGEEVGSTTGPAGPWKAAGPLVIGAGDTTTGSPSHYLKGRIDDVVVWHSTVSAKGIKNMFGTNETVVS